MFFIFLKNPCFMRTLPALILPTLYHKIKPLQRPHRKKPEKYAVFLLIFRKKILEYYTFFVNIMSTQSVKALLFSFLFCYISTQFLCFHYNIINRLQSQSEMIRDISEISGDGSLVYDKEDIKWESLLLSREKAVVMCLI